MSRARLSEHRKGATYRALHPTLHPFDGSFVSMT
jgi:hypothetical protein